MSETFGRKNDGLEVVVIDDMSLPTLDDEQRRKKYEEVVTHERNVYCRSYLGQGDFGEYVSCQDPGCRRIEDAETMHPELLGNPDLTLEGLEEEKGLDFGKCPDCGTEYGLIFDPEVFWAYLREYFRRKIIVVDGEEKHIGVAQALLLDKDGQILGNTIGYPHNAAHAFQENINYRNSYNWAEVSLLLADKMQVPVEQVAGQIVMIWNRIAISRQNRNKGAASFFNEMVSKLLARFAEYDDKPMIGDTRLDSRLWPLLSAIGYEEVARDDYGWVLIYLETMKQLRDALALSSDEFKEEFGERLNEARESQGEYIIERNEERQLYIAEHGHPKPRHFRGAVLVNDFREVLLGDKA